MPRAVTRVGFTDWTARVWERHNAATGETAEERARMLAEAEAALRAARENKTLVDRLTSHLDEERLADQFAPLIADAFAAADRRTAARRKKRQRGTG